jgi:DNA-binding MarR family transcriptional regulator
MKDSLHYRLRACHLSCQKRIVQDLKNETDLKPGEPKILEFLAEHEPCEQKEIAHGCDLDSASVTGILRRMEDRGLIHREMKDGNRRSLYVSMTPLGRSRLLHVEQTFGKIDEIALSGFSAKDREAFFHMLDLVYRNLKRRIYFEPHRSYRKK